MKTKVKQLNLSKETVKTLNQTQLAQVNGGTCGYRAGGVIEANQ